MSKRNYRIQPENPAIETLKSIGFLVFIAVFFFLMWSATPGCASSGMTAAQRDRIALEQAMETDIDTTAIQAEARRRAEEQSKPLFTSTGRTATIEIRKVNPTTGQETVVRRATVRLEGSGRLHKTKVATREPRRQE